MDFWQRVKTQIKSQDTSQAWVANKIPIGPEKFSRWISSNVMPKADQAQIIAQALNTTVEYLVTGKESVPDRIPAWAKEIVEDLAVLPPDVRAVRAKDIHRDAEDARAKPNDMHQKIG